MKTLIQQIGTGEYLNKKGSWSQVLAEARAFPSSLEAIDYCVTHRLKKVELVLSFADSRFDIRLRPFESPQ